MKVISRLFLGLTMMAVSAAVADPVPITWNAAEQPATLADGAVTLTYADGRIATLVATVPISVSGDTMQFASGATITLPQGESAFANDLEATDTLKFDGNLPMGTVLESGTLTDPTPMDNQAAAKIIDCSISDLSQYRVLDASLRNYFNGPVSTYHEKWTGTDTLQVQLQGVNHKDWVRMLMIKLTRKDDGVYAQWVRYAKLGGRKYGFSLGDDFSSLGNSVSQGYATMRSDEKRLEIHWNQSEIDLASIRLIRKDAVESVKVNLSGILTGGVVASTAVNLSFADDAVAALAAEDDLVLSNATVEVDATTATTVATVPTGLYGRLRIRPVAEGDTVPVNTHFVNKAGATTEYPNERGIEWVISSDWAKDINDIVGLAAIDFRQKDGVNPQDAPENIWVGHWERYSDTVYCQIQAVNGDFVKCIYLRFRQKGAKIWCAHMNNLYKRVSEGAQLGDDMLHASGVTGDISKCFYWVKEMDVVFRDRKLVVFTGSSTNTDAKSVLELGANVRGIISNQYVFPQFGAVEVGSNATLIAAAKGTGTTGKNNNPYFLAGYNGHISLGGASPVTVRKGGSLIFENDNVLGTRQKLVLDGGQLLNRTAPYLGTIELRNGGRIAKSENADYRNYFGQYGCANILARGTAPSFVDGDIRFLYSTAYSTPGVGVFFDVDNVTGTADPDLFFAGRMYDHGKSYKGGPLVKLGPGTLSITGKNAFVGETRILDGTLLLGADGVLYNAPVVSEVTFDGPHAVLLGKGEIATAAGTVNEIPATLKLTDAGVSKITLADGSRLTFLDSSAVEWAEGATLQITADLSKSSIRFGTNSTGLTPEQVRKIRVNGHRVQLDANGNLVPFGMVLIVR